MIKAVRKQRRWKISVKSWRWKVVFWQDARRRFMYNRAAVASLIVLFLIALFVTVAPMLSQFTYFDTD